LLNENISIDFYVIHEGIIADAIFFGKVSPVGPLNSTKNNEFLIKKIKYKKD